MAKNVFKLWQNMADYNETHLYGGLNEDFDWSIFYSLANGEIAAKDFPVIHLKHKSNKVLKKDLVPAPAETHFISQKFRDHFGEEAFEGSILVPATINDVTYYAWVFTTKSDCLNQKESQIKEFQYDEEGNQIPFKFVFYEDKIKDNRFFKLPEDQFEVPYCDEIIGRKILASDLNLMAQPLIYEEKNLRKCVTYHNPIAGIEFDEPADWILECKQLTKLKQGKKLTDKDWELKFEDDHLDFGLFSLFRKQLLISSNWLQKGEIHIGLTRQSAKDLFNERSSIKPTEFKHTDLDFECKINEYEWEKTFIAPYKDGLNLYVLVINRNHYPSDDTYKEEALDIVRSIRFKK